jgi:hypothetical protein
LGSREDVRTNRHRDGDELGRVQEEYIPFFFFSVRALVARLVVFSLGIVKVD